MTRQRSILINRRIPLGALLQTETFELINIRSIFKYDDAGNKTNEIVGFVYSVGETTEYSNAIVHAFQGFRAPFSGKIVHIFPEQSAAFN